MKSFGLAASALFAATTILAETPPGFVPAVAGHLEIRIGTKVVTPGLDLTKAETAKQPTYGTTQPLNGTYIWIFIDPDIGSGSGARSTYLHSLGLGWKSAATATDGIYTLSSTTTPAKAYMGPAPPAENPPYPHKYTHLFIPQPDGYKIPTASQQMISRGVGFNVTQFIADGKLEQPVVANWWKVAG